MNTLSSKHHELYKKVIEDLTQGKRPLLRLKDIELEEIANELESHLDSKEITHQLLCILDHCITQSKSLEKVLFLMMKNPLNDELLIFTLSVFNKQIIARNLKEGIPLNIDILQILKDQLKNQNMEVREWALRVCESIGKQNLKIKTQILESRPKVFLFKNIHEKNCIDLIELMQKQWKAIGL